jgi:hypothetical protein
MISVAIALDLALAVATLATGLRAAWLWLKSSRVPIDLGYQAPGLPPTFKRVIGNERGRPVEIELPRFVEPPGGSVESQVMATWDAMARSGPLNGAAAKWTAASVILSALTAVVGALAAALPSLVLAQR